MDERAQRALAAITPERVVEIASDLIRIPSFKTEETPLARWLASWFEERGYEVELQEVEPERYQVLARLRGAGDGQTLTLYRETRRVGHGVGILTPGAALDVDVLPTVGAGGLAPELVGAVLGPGGEPLLPGGGVFLGVDGDGEGGAESAGVAAGDAFSERV